MPQSNKLEDQIWYHGTLPRGEIERLLMEDGMFLVRASATTGRNRPIISVRAEGRVCHVPIESKDGKWHLEGDTTFPTICHLVRHFHSKKVRFVRVSDFP